MTAEVFTELSARAAVLLANQAQLLAPIRERRRRLLTVLKEAKLIGMEGQPPASDLEGVSMGNSRRSGIVSVMAAMGLLVLSGCAPRSHCSELLSPSFGGEGTLTPAQVAIFHGCYDGDTCTFTLPAVPPPFGNQIPVRLAGIDTPEMHGKCEREKALARQAQAVTTGLLTGAKQIELVDMRRDKYFRVLAGIRADGTDVAGALLKAGLAVPYGGGTKTARWCEG